MKITGSLLCDCCKTIQVTCLKNRDANGQSLCDSCLRSLRCGYRPAKWRSEDRQSS